MRILTVSNLYPPEGIGGWELGCAQMVEELRRRGHAVHVVTSTPRTFETAVDERDVRRVLHVEEAWDPVLIGHDTPTALIRRFLVNVHNVDLLRQEIDNINPDVVYTWNLIGLGAAAISLAVELRGLPWVAHLMDAMPRHVAAVAGAQRHHFAGLLNRRLVGTWLACSQGLLDEIAGSAAPLQGVVEVVPNWVVGPRPLPRESWYRPGRPLRCVYAGQLVASKGIILILEALAKLRAEGHDVELDLFGEGADRAGFEAHAIRFGVDGAVRFRGLLDQRELMSKLSAYDVMLYPTETREPFGFAPLEAAAAGCVPLVTAGCGITEWLVEGVHLLTAPRHAEDFADVLRRIVAGEMDLAPIARRGQRVVLRDFHIEAIAPRVERLLHQAVELRTPSQPIASWQDIGRMARIGELLADRVLFVD